MENEPKIAKTDLPNGIIYAPYVIENRATYVNQYMMWNKNPWINFLLKVRYFFFKPKALKGFKRYSEKKIDSKFYESLTIRADGNSSGSLQKGKV